MSAVLAEVSDSASVGPGVGSFLVIFGLAIATVLLIRSMTGHLRKVRYTPEDEGRPTPPPSTDRTGQP